VGSNTAPVFLGGSDSGASTEQQKIKTRRERYLGGPLVRVCLDPDAGQRRGEAVGEVVFTFCNLSIDGSSACRLHSISGRWR
jgi:hypothetical protein